MKLEEHEVPGWVRYRDTPWTPPDVADEVALATGIAHESWMQDWPIEAAHTACLEQVLELAEKETRPDHLAAFLTILLCRLDDDLTQGEQPDEATTRRITAALSRYPEVTFYWMDSLEDGEENAFSVAVWLSKNLK